MGNIRDYVGPNGSPDDNVLNNLFFGIKGLNVSGNNWGYQTVVSRFDDPKKYFTKLITKKPYREWMFLTDKMWPEIEEVYRNSGIESTALASPSLSSKFVNVPTKHRIHASTNNLTLDVWTPKGTMLWSWIHGRKKVKAKLKSR